jgi:chromosome segregation ATPase
MTKRFGPSVRFAIVPLLLLFATPARAQLNKAYDDGYRPMLDLASQLKDLADSAEKRAAYSSVKDLANRFKDKLDIILNAFEYSLSSSGKLKDGDNISWFRATISPTQASTRAAKTRAERLYAKADAGSDSKAEVIDLQVALTDLSDTFKKCWQEHNDRLQKLRDIYVSTLERFKDSTRDARRPINDLGARVNDARDRLNDLTARARDAGRVYIDAQDQVDRARADLFNADVTRTPDEVKAKYDAWTRADDLAKKVELLLVDADTKAADAQRTFSDALAAWEKAMAEFDKKEADSNLLYALVLDRHKKMFEMGQEYRPFSW